MGMFSEVAIEGTIRAFVEEIRRELEINQAKPDAVVALRKLGRFALTQFEWGAPDWAKEYAQLFAE